MVYILFLLPIVIVAALIGRNPKAQTPVAWFVLYFTAFLIAGLFLGIVFSQKAWEWGLAGAAFAMAIRWGLFGLIGYRAEPTPEDRSRGL
ncbi:MAG: hypothetical protein ACYCUI_09600 [Vulcanimicrobiaceae bacterium]|jgi:hypothetical protein